MATQWYIQTDGKEFGPYSSSDVKTMAEKEKISHDTLVRNDLQKEWLPAYHFDGLIPGPSPMAAHTSKTTPANPNTSDSTWSRKQLRRENRM